MASEERIIAAMARLPLGQREEGEFLALCRVVHPEISREHWRIKGPGPAENPIRIYESHISAGVAASSHQRIFLRHHVELG
tara:strand:+ start:178 stop:420 length:243 start_codon:yes stop_codon:yes gene_type:complete